MIEKNEDEEWEPLPLRDPLMGHMLTGFLFKGTISTLLIWLLAHVPGVGRVSFGDIVLVVVVETLIVETLTVLVDRVFVLRYRKDEPETKLNHVISVLCSFVIGFGVGWLVLGTLPLSFVCGGVVGLVNLGEVLWVKPWTRGMTREEVAEKWVATKQMTSEVFADDIQEVKKRSREAHRRRYEREHGSDD